MPANEQIWRPLPTMHLWFAGSTVALALATWMMVQKDERLEWRDYQRTANQLKQEKLDAQLAAFETASFTAKVEAAEKKIAAAEAALEQQADRRDELLAEIKSLQGEFVSAQTAAKFQNAVRDVRRADLDIAVRDGVPADALAAAQARFDAEQVKAGELTVRVQTLDATLDAKKAELAALTAAVAEAEAEKAALLAEKSRLLEQRDLISPSNRAVALKRQMKEWPILNAFNPHLRIQYDWPALDGAHPMLPLGMAKVQRVDRCRTCHVNISDFGAGNVPGYPHGDELAAGEYPHPFSSHPHPELYLTSASPHPIEKFGCTVCHYGDGSGTSFQNAEHSPDNPAEAEHWHHDHNWHSNHFWEQPMLPTFLAEATCIKCHHNVVELGQNSKFGASAPKVVEGFELIKEYGCYGCHPINGYDGTRPIGPDLRLEPQTEAEALAIAADPNQVAGRERKVGPALTHVAAKVQPGFISYWTEEPKRFRPDTRMPQFFHLDNQEDRLAELLQPVELAGIEAYLQAYSQPLALQQPREGYVPDAERGKNLFAQRGCLACHSHNDEEFAGIRQSFGPNLSRIYEKIKRDEDGFSDWLYTWLKQPTLHHPRTRMPDLFLDPDERGGNYVDPAADIAAYLLAGEPGTFAVPQLPGPYLGVVTEKVDGGLRVIEVLPNSPASRAVIASDAGGQPPALRIGDIIVSVAGADASTPESLDSAIAGMTKDQPVSLTINRLGVEQAWTTTLSTPMDDLVRLYLGKALGSEAQVAEAFDLRRFPISDAAWTPLKDGSLPARSTFVKGDEIELAPTAKDETVAPDEWERRKLLYIGRRTISRYGCYGCHDIPGFEEARPIGTALQDWGRKDTAQLATEHIHEYLHHHGEPDGSSTIERVEQLISREYYDGNTTHGEQSEAFFLDSLLHHGRAGFLWQKLRAPRSYDYMKTSTKGWDERLRMPKFPFQQSEIESIATFVLGLVADPPAEPYLYDPSGPAGDIIEGERLLAKYNCGGCHMLEMPGFNYNVNIREFVGLTRAEIVDFLTRHAKALAEGTLTQEMLRTATVPDAAWAQILAEIPEAERAAAQEREAALLEGMSEFVINCETLLTAESAGVEDIEHDVAPLLGLLAQSPGGIGLQDFLKAHPETLIADPIGAGDYADAVRLALQLKPPVSSGDPITESDIRRGVEFHGLQYSTVESVGVDTFDLWENLEIGGRFKLAGINSRLVADEENPAQPSEAARGGDFAVWLYNRLAIEANGGDVEGSADKMYPAMQSSVPPLYREGIKVQTPWLYQFLLNPQQLRYTTVLRMPRFNMDPAEARALANYFAAVDGAAYPYQEVDRREPGYLAEREFVHQALFAESSGDYLTQSWNLINGNQCIKCHNVGGRQYKPGGTLGPDGQPVDIQGPDLKRVQDRLRPDWTQLWVYNPKWMTPYTSMPANLPRDQVNFPALYGGDGRWQNEALVDALMNYGALLERLGVVDYGDGKTPPGGAGTTPATPPANEAPADPTDADSAPPGADATSDAPVADDPAADAATSGDQQ